MAIKLRLTAVNREGGREGGGGKGGRGGGKGRKGGREGGRGWEGEGMGLLHMD